MGCDGECACKKEQSFDRLAELRGMMGSGLIPSTHDSDVSYLSSSASPTVRDREGYTIIQFSGFAINLYADGKWIVTDTSGG